MEDLLRVESLQTHFFTSMGVARAVDGVSFSLKRGGRVGIVGESGCGKSVTALSLLRLVAPPGRTVGGHVYFGSDSQDLLALRESEIRKIRGARIAMIFQEPMTSLNPVFTIENQIGEGIALHRQLGPEEVRAEVRESLRLVGVADPDRVARAYPHELSGGMRQRAMIAMALSCRPELLIADEPTTALDVTIQAQVLGLLRELQEKLGMATLLITHDLGVIAESVEEVLVMYAGWVVERAATERLFQQPRHPYTRALLHSLPTLHGEASSGRLPTIPGTVPDLTRLPGGCVFQGRCARVEARCREEVPPMTSVDPGHDVRCFFP